jgi:Acyltransferase family
MLVPAVLFAMSLFFLLAGLLTPGSLDRKGPRRFADDRLLRLGAPWVAFALVLWPLTVVAMYRAVGASPSSAWADLTEPPLDTGPLWFLAVLLLYSLGYAAWSRLGARLPWAPGQRGRHAGASPGRLRGRHLAAVAVGIAAASFVVRLWFPLGSAQVANLKPWQWPQFLAMFRLGVISARRGWLAPVPDRLRRGCGLAALAATLSFPLLVLVASAVGLPADLELFLGGWRWRGAGKAGAGRRRRWGRRLVRAGVAARHPDPPRPDPVGRAATHIAVGVVRQYRNMGLPSTWRISGR